MTPPPPKQACVELRKFCLKRDLDASLTRAPFELCFYTRPALHRPIPFILRFTAAAPNSHRFRNLTDARKSHLIKPTASKQHPAFASGLGAAADRQHFHSRDEPPQHNTGPRQAVILRRLHFVVEIFSNEDDDGARRVISKPFRHSVVGPLSPILPSRVSPYLAVRVSCPRPSPSSSPFSPRPAARNE